MSRFRGRWPWLRVGFAFLVTVVGCSSPGNRDAGTGEVPAGAQGCLGSDIDLWATPISIPITVNGQPTGDPDSLDFTEAYLRRGSGLDEEKMRIGSPFNTFGMVFPGTYDVYYSGLVRIPPAPGNLFAKVQSRVVVGSVPREIAVDIPSTHVLGRVTVVSAPTKTNEVQGNGLLSLVNDAGDLVLLASAPVDQYSLNVIPGTYDLIYQGPSFGGLFPTNQRASLQSGIVVGASTLVLDVHVPATLVSGTVTINGTATGSPSQGGKLTLKNVSGDSAPLLTYAEDMGAFSAMVIPGTYDVYWTGGAGDAVENSAVKVQSGLVVGADPISFTVDIPASTVSGKVSLDGVTSPDIVSRFTLRGAGNDAVRLRGPTADSFSVRVVPGTYDLYYGSQAVGIDKPRADPGFKVKSGIVVGPSPLALNVDVPITAVSGRITINGRPMASQGIDHVDVVLASRDGGRWGFPFISDEYPIDGRVMPGLYDMYMTWQVDAAPASTARIRSGILIEDSPVALDVDVRGTVMAGNLRINGEVPAPSVFDRSFIALLDDENNAQSLAGLAASHFNSERGAYANFLVSGTYRAYYMGGGEASISVPENPRTYIGCFVVP